MKKLLFLTAVCAITTAPAMAVQQCVALTMSTIPTCGNPSLAPNGIYNWVLPCTVNGNAMNVSGIFACSNMTGSIGQISENLTTGYTAEGQKGCWCKTTSPFVSKWVGSGVASTLSDCLSNCGNNCINNLKSNTAGIWQAIAQSLTN